MAKLFYKQILFFIKSLRGLIKEVINAVEIFSIPICFTTLLSAIPAITFNIGNIVVTNQHSSISPNSIPETHTDIITCEQVGIIIININSTCTGTTPLPGPNGQTAHTDFVILSKDKQWKLASNDFLENGQRADSTIKNYFLREDKLKKFLKYQHIIVLGLASQEGESMSEKKRSQERAQTLENGLDAISNIPMIWQVHLGKYGIASTQQESTGRQRRVIVMGLKNAPKDFSSDYLKYGLAKVFKGAFKDYEFDRYEFLEVEAPIGTAF